MKRIVRTGDRQAYLDFSNTGDHVSAALAWEDGDPCQHDFRYAEVEPGVYSVLCNHRSAEVRVTRSGEGWLVEIGVRSFLVEVEDPREAAPGKKGAAGEGRHNIKSPMPGKVVRVLVEEGATVEEGQGLVVVEAMKMQNEMRAPGPGRVIALTARAGASVTAGEVLVIIE